MEKETSCINSRAILDYLKEHNLDCSILFGDLDPEIDNLEDLEKFLRDPNNWVSCSVISKLYKRAKLILHDDKAAYKMGKYASENISLGYAQRIVFKSFWSVRKTLKNAQKINDKWNRSKKVELIELKQNEAIVRLHWNSEMEVTKDICLYNQGAYTSLPLVWGGSPLTLKEKCCYFNGAPYCEYHLKWPFKNKFYEFFSRFFTTKSVLMDTIKEMERDKKIIEQKTDKLKNEIEERKQAEAALRESEERFSKAFHSNPIPLLISTLTDGRCIDVNEGFLRALGYSHEEVIGRTSSELMLWVDPNDRLKVMQALEQGKRIILPEVKFRAKSGEIRIMMFSADKIELGGEECLITTANDITYLKQAEEEREKLIEELQEALKEIKTLRGILPLCSFCKKIRDDKGYWEQVDVYIDKNSPADISHSVCPECAEKHYPDLDV